MHYVVKCSDFEWPARDLFKVIGGGVLKANINYEYALKAAIEANKKIQSDKALGSTFLVP